MNKRLWKYSLWIGLAWAVLAVPVWPEVIAKEGDGVLERIDGQLLLRVKGDYYDMGYQHGKLLAEQIQRNVKSITDNEKNANEPAYLLYKMSKDSMHQRLLPHMPQRYLDEIRGIAEGSGVPYEKVLETNLFPEAFHCSGFALMGDATEDGSLYHVRILDYMTDAGFQDNAVTTIYEPKDHNTWLNVGYAGMAGTVTAMNAKNVAIGEMGGKGQGAWDGVPMSFLLREVMENASTLDEGMKILRETPRTCEYYYVISDSKIPDARGVYATPLRISFSKPGTNYGFFNLPKAPEGDVGGDKVLVDQIALDQSEFQIYMKDAEGREGFINLQPKDTVVISGQDRSRYFMERLKPHYGKVDEKVLMDLVKRPVAMKSNLHIAIFHPSTGEAWVAHAGPNGEPACDQPYVRFSLDGTNVKTALK